MLLFKFGILVIIQTVSIYGRFIPCIFGSENKCLGKPPDDLIGIPNSDANLIEEFDNITNYFCFDQCSNKKNCFMAAYEKINRTCQLYSNISFTDRFDSTYMIFVWNCCDLNTSYLANNRCPGFWKMKQNSISNNRIRKNDFLYSFHSKTIYECQMKCLDNIICGSININMSVETNLFSCNLVIGFPVENCITQNQPKWSTYIWECAHNYTLPVPKKDCVSRDEHKPGYWIIVNDSVPFPENLQSLLFFHTFDYKSCLENCKLFKHCYKAWYSSTSLFCMLESDGLASCAEQQVKNSYVYTTYIWKNCDVTTNPLSTLQIKKIRKCRKIKNNEYMYILHSNCGNLPSNISNIYKCFRLEPVDKLQFTENLHCLNNQSFQIIENNNLTFTNLSWINVFTGYESFWLGNVTEENFPISDFSECNIYNCNMQPDEPTNPKIISRENWFAKKPRKNESLFSKTSVHYVIITDTERPFCNCLTEESCSYQIRMIQDVLYNFFHIPYNFIITGNGLIYEAKGWKFENQATGELYNNRSLSIALCGRYHEEPSVLSLNLVKIVINEAIKLKKIIENYTLYLHNDIGNIDLPFEGLQTVIKLWPHYRGYRKSDCNQIGLLVIVMNIISFIIVSILFIVLYHFFIRILFHDKLCNVVKKFKIEFIYGNFNHDNNNIDKDVEEDNSWKNLDIRLDNIDNLRKQNSFISPFTSSLFWIENKIEIDIFNNKQNCSCKKSVFSFFNLSRFLSSVVDLSLLTRLPELEICSKTIMFIFDKNSTIDHQYLMILHCDSINSAKKFIDFIHQNKCTCSLFNIYLYAPSTKTFKLAHDSMKISKFTELTDSTVRVIVEREYSFVLDDIDSVSYYK